jgi:hypothetical protein
MSARARRRRAFLVASIAVLAALTTAEIGARVLDARIWRPLPPFGRSAVQREWLERSERELATGAEPGGYSGFDPELGWTTRRSYAAPDGAVHVNARGLRGTREYGEPRPEGTFRVVACGDSFTFGEEVRDGEAWTARLEARVPGLEVLNYGVGGYGTDQALLRLSREARAPVDAVLVGLMLENIGRNVNRYRPLWYPSSQPAAKPRYVLGPSRLELVAQPFAARAEFVAAVRSGDVFARLAEHEHWSDAAPPAFLRWSTAARLVAGQRAYGARKLEPLWTDIEGEPFRTTLALLEAFRPLARELGTEHVLVLVFPMRTDLPEVSTHGRRYWMPLLHALDARAIPYLDLAEPLAAAMQAGGELATLYGESHLSARGNEIVAAAIAARLSDVGAPLAPR